MHQQSQINTLLFIVAVLAIVGGLAIVIFTSPQSWEFGPVAWLQSLSASPTRIARANTPSPSPAPSRAAPPATATATIRPTITILTVTVAPSDTPTPVLSATATLAALPADVRALAVVVVSLGTNSARVRDQPNGQSVIAAVSGGTMVQVLFGQVKVADTNWVEVRLADGQVGWMAEFLLQITQSRP